MNRLSVEGMSKEDRNITIIDNLSFKLKKGQSMIIKCSEELTLLLIDMILGKIIPSKGTIFIEEKTPDEYMKKFKQNIAIIYKEEGFYERLSIKDYLQFFHGLYHSKIDLQEAMSRFALLDIANYKISSLNYSQKKRLSFARALISKPKILLIQEPTLNLDRQSSRLIRESIVYMKALGITILAFSISLEDTILLDGDSYILNEKGFNPIENDSEDENNVENQSDQSDELESPHFKIDKIPAKIDDKIILFNPMEINYIETSDGACYINVETEKFPCSLTLNSLESRLKYFGFFRCHRSYLVNLQRVREVITWTRNSYSLILDNKDKSSIPLSKGRIDELKQILDL